MAEVARYPKQCLLEQGCPRDREAHTPIVCPDLPTLGLRELVEDPNRHADQTVVLRATLAVVGWGTTAAWELGSCGGASFPVALEESLDGLCYAVELSGTGLSCRADRSMACCGGLPVGREVFFTGRYVNDGGDGPFHVTLAGARLCTRPGESLAVPVR